MSALTIRPNPIIINQIPPTLDSHEIHETARSVNSTAIHIFKNKINEILPIIDGFVTGFIDGAIEGMITAIVTYVMLRVLQVPIPNTLAFCVLCSLVEQKIGSFKDWKVALSSFKTSAELQAVSKDTISYRETLVGDAKS